MRRMGRACGCAFREPGTGINLDPVRADCGLNADAGGGGDDDAGGLHRHVAVDAVGGDAVTEAFRSTTALPSVAGEAARGIGGSRTLGGVDVMAGGAGHLRGGKETFAALEEANLVAVNVGTVWRRGVRG